MSTTLLKCLKVIETLAQSEQPRGISELARAVDLNKSAVQRIFKTLEQSGYVEKAGGGSRYQLTLKVWQIGAQVIERHDLRRQIHPILRYGAKASGLTVFFVIAEVPDAVYLDKVEGEKGRPHSSEPGRRFPMHLTASGKAILAFLPQSDREELYAGAEVPAERRAALEAELRRIRAEHFSTSISGSTAGVNSVAAPVWDSQGAPVGSVCITGHAGVMPESDLANYGQQAVALADQATRVIGGVIPGLGDENP